MDFQRKFLVHLFKFVYLYVCGYVSFLFVLLGALGSYYCFQNYSSPLHVFYINYLCWFVCVIYTIISLYLFMSRKTWFIADILQKDMEKMNLMANSNI